MHPAGNQGVSLPSGSNPESHSNLLCALLARVEALAGTPPCQGYYGGILCNACRVRKAIVLLSFIV